MYTEQRDYTSGKTAFQGEWPIGAVQVEERKDPLSSRHRRMLEADSAISAEAIESTGYRTVTEKSELMKLGFSEAQARVPGLLVPIWSPAGELVSYQFRPDCPREIDGKPVKYESLPGTGSRLHAPPFVLAKIQDPRQTLVITEGVRKADCAASRGVACVALPGVWNWKVRNESGGSVTMGDFENVPLKGRDVVLCFDSDAATKEQVLQAERRLAGFLRSKGARVRVARIPDPGDGSKDGLDDFAAKGGDLQSLIEGAAEFSEEGLSDFGLEYESDEEGTWRVKRARGQCERILLANFSARIARQIERTDGVSSNLMLEIVVRRRDVARSVVVSADRFERMDWVTESLGAEFWIAPGRSSKEYFRHAVQVLSGQGIPRRKVLTSTGWFNAEEGRVFILLGGAVGRHGLAECESDLPECLHLYRPCEPATGDGLIEGIRALLGALRCAPARVTAPLVASFLRAPLGGSNYMLWLAAPTMSRKSSLCAALLGLYGGPFHAGSLPASWSGTANSIEYIAHMAKDLPLVVDDFVPDRGRRDRDACLAAYSRLARAQGNLQARSRMRADGSLAPTHKPRCLIVSTAEAVPEGFGSELNRTVVLEFGSGDVDNGELSKLQSAHRALHGCGMAWLGWLAGRLEEAQRRLWESVSAHMSGDRLSEQIAQMECAFELFLEFAGESGLPEAEALEARRSFLDGMEALARAQREAKAERDPALEFYTILEEGLASGAVYAEDGTLQAPSHGRKIGYKVEGRLNLIKGETMAYLNESCQRQGRPFGMDGRSLWRLLAERGLLRVDSEGKLSVPYKPPGGGTVRVASIVWPHPQLGGTPVTLNSGPCNTPVTPRVASTGAIRVGNVI